MKVHRNAKTTPYMRSLLIERIQQPGWTMATAATAAGISVRTAYKWQRRYRLEGPAGLTDRSSRPHRQPRRTAEDRVVAILAARYRGLTAWAIAVQLQIPRSTVAIVLARAGLNRLARLTPALPAVRYEYGHVGALIHFDIKPLARIVRVGHRIHGDRARSVEGAGYEYAHVAVDDHSRVAYVEVLPDQRGRTAAGFFRRAAAWFAQRGVRILRVLTDNGSAYRAEVFRALATRRRIRLLRTRPYRPQTNGKAERFIQTLIREWAYRVPYPSSARRTRALKPWLRYYNTVRPHTALGYQPPCARFPRAAQ